MVGVRHRRGNQRRLDRGAYLAERRDQLPREVAPQPTASPIVGDRVPLRRRGAVGKPGSLVSWENLLRNR
jgi:hypothetical protein